MLVAPLLNQTVRWSSSSPSSMLPPTLQSTSLHRNPDEMSQMSSSGGVRILGVSLASHDPFRSTRLSPVSWSMVSTSKPDSSPRSTRECLSPSRDMDPPITPVSTKAVPPTTLMLSG